MYLVKGKILPKGINITRITDRFGIRESDIKDFIEEATKTIDLNQDFDWDGLEKLLENIHATHADRVAMTLGYTICIMWYQHNKNKKIDD